MEKDRRESKATTDQRRKNAAEWGREGERIVKDYLASRGMPVVAENWRCGSRLEIDLISQQGDEIVFIEVKTRNGKYNSAEDAVDKKKIKQIVKAANAYLQSQERDYSARFDVALVEGTPDDYELSYLENAFIPPLK